VAKLRLGDRKAKIRKVDGGEKGFALIAQLSPRKQFWLYAFNLLALRRPAILGGNKEHPP
jgi:hypothetical protein